jgi:serine/threonine-protein kinase
MSDAVARLNAALEGRYAIERELGEGGMATVYLADDLKHERKVALKVLKPDLAAAVGAQRFLAEIKTTASLQHPHILPLFDSGEAHGSVYYVMPFIDGETVRDKLDREKQLGIDEAVRIATDVAGALDYAHRSNVIHRDIKPENILLHDGRAMVTDFGIALAVSAAGGERLTETGLSLGTPHYMSPEQATAEETLTNRSDIYSLGAVLYEMFTGERPHTGKSARQIIVRIVTDEAQPVTELRKSVPAHMAATTAKALEKLPADRFETASQFAEALTNPAFAFRTSAVQAIERTARAELWRRYAWPAAAVLFLGLAIWRGLPEPPDPVARYGLAFPPDQQLVDVFHPTFAFAPDASWIVYVGPGGNGGQLWVKRRDEYRATLISDTEGAVSPVVSADGEWIAFIANGQLRKVPVGGGSVITLADSVQTGLRVATWLDDGTLIYSDQSWRLRRVPDVGGPAEVVFTPEPSFGAYSPTPLPDGRGVLFTYCRPGPQCAPQQEAWVLDLSSGEARMLMQDIVRSWYVETGHLVYVRVDGDVLAVPFDLASLEVQGAPVPLLEGVQVDRGTSADFALSESGELMMISGLGEGQGGGLATLVSVDRNGTATPVDPDWAFQSSAIQGIALSPEGERLAINIIEETGENIWVKQLDGGPSSRLTFHDGVDARPRWTSDGQRLTFVSDRAGAMDLYSTRADGTGPAEMLLDMDPEIFEGSWSPDGTWLIIRAGGDLAGTVGGRDIWGMRPGIDSVPAPLVADEWDEKAFALSPDGRWLAYESDESGNDEVYVRPFPDTESGKWLVSTSGGLAPAWAHNGRELFYVEPQDGRKMMVAAVETEPTFRVGERRALFPLGSEYRLPQAYTAYDVALDDQRFLMVRLFQATEDRVAGTLIIVENWFEELKERVAN